MAALSRDARALSSVLECIAEHGSTFVRVPDVARQCDVEPHFVRGALASLHYLGALKEASDGAIAVVSEPAANYLRSLALYLKHGATFVEDWSRGGADTGDKDSATRRGVCLLALMEGRRAKLCERVPLRSQEVVKAFIKGRAADGRSAFLMELNARSQRYQLVGGAIREGETPAVAMRRELAEEVATELGEAGACVVEALGDEPTVVRFVSPTHGVYTEYRAHYYVAKLGSSVPAKPLLRWVSLDELLAGKTIDGHLTLPPPDVVSALRRRLEMLPYGVDEIITLGSGANQISADNQRYQEDASSSAVKSPLRLLAAAGIFVLLLGATLAGLVIAAKLVPDHLPLIATAALSLLVVALAFAAAAADVISGRELVDMLKEVLTGRGRPGVPRTNGGELGTGRKPGT